MVIQKELIFPENIKFHVLLEQLNHSVFFDIETTGLSWRTSHLYLIGAAFMENGCWTLQQWFLQKPSEEKELLLQFSSFLSSFTQVIHYNGQGFDLPYLAHKYEDYRLPDPFAHMESLDLYRMVRPFRILLSLSSLKQKDVERLLEIPRKDCCSGKELISRYQEYLGSGSEELLRLLLLHNHDDVCGLLPLYSVTAYSSLRSGGFTVSNPVFEEQRLILPLQLIIPLPRPLFAGHERYALEAKGCKAALTVCGKEGTMKHFYDNYTDYYYLPLEDEAIHKSVGVYVDPAHRQKARPSNCYQKAAGLFFPQPYPRFSPAFYAGYRQRPAYFLPDDCWPDSGQKLKDYASDLLEEIITQAR